MLPPIAKLTREQAMYYFLSGYTAKVAGTERGVNEPQATFSSCFGAVFLVWHPTKYAEMLGQLIDEHGSRRVAGEHRLERRRLRRRQAHEARLHARDGARAARRRARRTRRTRRIRCSASPIPTAVPTCPPRCSNPRSTWRDKAAYDAQAKKLAAMFRENFEKFEKSFRRRDERGARIGLYPGSRD